MQYLLNKFWLLLALSICELLAIIFLSFLLFVSSDSISSSDSTLHSSEMLIQHLDTATSSLVADDIDLQTQYITVDIGGAVRYPGVYLLEDTSILADLVLKAGGFRSDVIDIHLLQRQLNLAELLKNGQKYYIPYLGELWSSSASNSLSSSIVSSTSGDTLISINSADLKMLQTLPGVGEVRAQAIIDNRPYSALTDLLSKSVVSDTLFGKIKDLICI